MATKLENLTTKLQSALDLANSLPDAITLDELTSPGSAATMLEGTEMLDAQGKKVTGNIASKSSSNLTASGATVTVPAGYYAEDASKSIETATWEPAYHAVNLTTGEVLFSQSTVSGGYVQPQTEVHSTTQLPTQAAKTVTPTKSSQTAVARNVYTTGVVTVGAIPDEYQDVSGVTATAARTAAGDVFVDADGVEQTGTLNISEIVYKDDAGDKAYVDVIGTVNNRLLVSVEPMAVTPSTSSQHITPSDGKLIRSVSVAAIPDEFADVSGVTATAATTLTGSKFVNSSGTLTSGTMPNNGTLSSTIDGLETKSVSIPKGYTDGGTVALDSTIDDTADSQAAQIAEIKAMLEGKSVSGGGSGGTLYTTEIQADAGTIHYTTVEDGLITLKTITSTAYTSHTVSVLEGTVVALVTSSYTSSVGSNAYAEIIDTYCTTSRSFGLAKVTGDNAVIYFYSGGGAEK